MNKWDDKAQHCSILWSAISVKLFHGQRWILYVICRYSFMLHPKTLAPYPNPSTILVILKCHMLNFINVMCEPICDMRYLICCMFSFICNMTGSIYDISMLLCSMSESDYAVTKIPFAYFKSFLIYMWKIAHSVSNFVASSLLQIW